MKTTINSMFTILSVSLITLAATSATACGGGGGGFKVGISYGGGHGGYGGGLYNNHHHHKNVYVKKVYVEPVVVAPCIYPLHSFCFVYPGDTWSLLSQREFGKPNFGPSIAAFNGLSVNLPLVVGQQLRLPVIHPNGKLTPSAAPAPAPFVLPNQPMVAGPAPNQPTVNPIANAPQAGPMMPNGPMSNGAMLNSAMPSGPMAAPTTSAPSASTRLISETKEVALPTVAIGSTLVLDGQLLGNEKGSVRLRINVLSLPVEVLEWSDSSAKIRLPEIELDSATKAEIEVLRVDGSVASKSAVELTPAATRLALGTRGE